jgi:hypothetical protein
MLIPLNMVLIGIYPYPLLLVMGFNSMLLIYSDSYCPSSQKRFPFRHRAERIADLGAIYIYVYIEWIKEI